MRRDLAAFSHALSTVVATAQASVLTVKCGSAVGAGVMISRRRAVTCWHVVRDGGALSVSGGRTESAAVIIARDVRNDLALLEVGLEAPAAMVAGEPKAGAVVVAIGAPAGKSRFSTVGVVARVGGVVDVAGGASLVGCIEIDCRVRRGNSGGGLFDIEGRLVGIIAAGRAEDDTGAAVKVAHVLRLLAADEDRRLPPQASVGDLQAFFRDALRQR